MQPTLPELLRGVVANLEELILPDLKPGHAASAGNCIRMVLNHVVLRLENEPQALLQDNAEKRELFARLSALIDRDAAARSVGRLPDLARTMSALAHESAPEAYVPTGRLVETNDRFKAVADELIQELHAHRAELGDAFEAIRQPLRSQLRAQMDREVAMIAPAMDGPMF